MHILVVSLSDQLVLIVDSVTQVTQMGGLVTEQNRCFCKLTLRLTCFRKHHADCSCGFITHFMSLCRRSLSNFAILL